MEEKKSFFDSFTFSLLSGVAIVLLLVNFVLRPCVVDGTSMAPTLSDGDRGLTFIITRNLGIERFDICIIEAVDNGKEKLLVKRCIGLPNETIEYKDNCLYINGEYVPEDFVNEGGKTEDFKIVLGDDEYFCLGDNRSVSKDSRYYGPFSSDNIKSTGFFTLYPFSNFGVKK